MTTATSTGKTLLYTHRMDTSWVGGGLGDQLDKLTNESRIPG